MDEYDYKNLSLGLQENLDEGIMKELGSTKGAYECIVCACIISGEYQAMQHSAGAKHLSKCQSRKHKRLSNVSSGSILDIEVESSTTVAESRELGKLSPSPEVNGREMNGIQDPLLSIENKSASEFYCFTCSVDLTGKIPYEQHINGKPHKRRLSHVKSLNIHAQESRSNTPTPPLLIPPHPVEKISPTFDPCIVESGQGVEKYKCTVCNGILLNGVNTIHQHLSGKSHLRNARNSLGPDSVSRKSVSPLHNASLTQLVSSMLLETSSTPISSKVHEPKATLSLEKATVKRVPQSLTNFRLFKVEDTLPNILQ